VPEPADFQTLLHRLTQEEVKFIVIGGMAMVSHGSAFITADLDICYARSDANLEALAGALEPLHPYLRGAPPELPFRLDRPTLKAGLNFTLTTDAGDLDLLGEVKGVGRYEDALPGSVEFEIYGHAVRIMGLDDIIRAKEAAGRDKDRIHLKELRELKKRSSD
jgi:predicted nucleotidyltransferase